MSKRKEVDLGCGGEEEGEEGGREEGASLVRETTPESPNGEQARAARPSVCIYLNDDHRSTRHNGNGIL